MDHERIRAQALVEAMLAMGVKEMTLRPQHVHDFRAYEITATRLPENQAVHFKIQRVVLIDGDIISADVSW